MSAHKDATAEQVVVPKENGGAPNEAQSGGFEYIGIERRRGAQDGLESDGQGRCSDGSRRWEAASCRAPGMHPSQQANMDDDSIHMRPSARERFPRPHQRRKHMTIEQALSAVFGARLLSALVGCFLSAYLVCNNVWPSLHLTCTTSPAQRHLNMGVALRLPADYRMLCPQHPYLNTEGASASVSFFCRVSFVSRSNCKRTIPLNPNRACVAQCYAGVVHVLEYHAIPTPSPQRACPEEHDDKATEQLQLQLRPEAHQPEVCPCVSGAWVRLLCTSLA